MNGTRIVRSASTAVLSGVAGALAVDGARRLAGAGWLRRGAVATAAWGLRGKRSVEAGAENVRLVAGDVVAEARARVGEQAPVPGGAGHDHDHQH